MISVCFCCFVRGRWIPSYLLVSHFSRVKPILSVHMRVLSVFARVGSLPLADISISYTSFGLSAACVGVCIRMLSPACLIQPGR